jgi:uncharacterized protein with von Willebrand factor type A (vWA) domain
MSNPAYEYKSTRRAAHRQTIHYEIERGRKASCSGHSCDLCFLHASRRARTEKSASQIDGAAEHLLIESQEEVRSDLRSRKFAQIRSDRLSKLDDEMERTVNPAKIDRKKRQRP